MPRLHPNLLRKSYSIEPHLTKLLYVCRDLPSARSELRWIREHARKTVSEPLSGDINRLVYNYVTRRSSGEPLQYILGSEFFGELDIKCRPGVLIPRQETAASVTNLVKLLSSNAPFLPSTLRVLDLCTGTGCIPLLFHHEFYSEQNRNMLEQGVNLDIAGIDVSPQAIDLAEMNRAVQVTALDPKSSQDALRQDSLGAIAFLRADVLQYEDIGAPCGALSPLRALKEHYQNQFAPANDILISNPPYISSTDYYRTTSPSVRRFEPKLALVPPAVSSGLTPQNNGDLFYPAILRVAEQLNSQVLLLEVANLQQAKRVASLVAQQDRWDIIEIWRDNPSGGAMFGTSELPFGFSTNAMTIRILGKGGARSILAYRGRGREWLQRPWR